MPPFSLSAHLAAIHDADAWKAMPEDVKRTQDLVATPTRAVGWEPKNDSMFVLPLERGAMSKSGLLEIPDEHRERPQKGVVLAVGPGLWDDEKRTLYPVQAQPGDLVTYGKYSGEVFEIGDAEGGTVEVFIMKNVEIKARRPRGTYPALIEHRVGEGTERDRHIYHEAHLKCEHCPTETSAIVEEERARLQQQHRKDLQTEDLS